MEIIRSTARTVVVAAFAVVVAPSPTAAQPASPGDVGVYFDLEATQTSTHVAPLEPFRVYVIATAPFCGGIAAYEFSLTAPEGVVVAEEALHPQGASDFGIDTAPHLRNYLVGWSGAICLDGALEVLVEFELLFLSEVVDGLICLGPANPSSFSPPRSGYLPWGPCDLVPFGAAYEGCAVVNPVSVEPPVATAVVSWGAFRALYGD